MKRASQNTVFVDTGAFYARYVPRDGHHQVSLDLWNRVRNEKIPCLTTNFVLSELVSLIVYRFGGRSALQAAREIYASNAIRILSVTHDLELKALDWIERFSDQKFSMTDAISFAVMEAEGIQTAFTFDHDFEIAGYQKFLPNEL